jgi:hypothetical protein
MSSAVHSQLEMSVVYCNGRVYRFWQFEGAFKHACVMNAARTACSMYGVPDRRSMVKEKCTSQQNVFFLVTFPWESVTRSHFLALPVSVALSQWRNVCLYKRSETCEGYLYCTPSHATQLYRTGVLDTGPRILFTDVLNLPQACDDPCTVVSGGEAMSVRPHV